ncbi:MAG: LemA family protein [Gammaproteobacteria bacterium]
MEFSLGNIILGLLVLAVVWFILTYNRFIKNKNAVRESWSGIDVQLKRRHNLIPNLVETVKGYAGHEQKTLDSLTALRAGANDRGNVAKVAKHENLLTKALANVFAVAENYPDLKANTNFLDLQQQITQIEDHLQLARRYYNGTVRDWNILVESFPSNLIASIFRFRIAEFFEIEIATERAVPQVQF